MKEYREYMDSLHLDSRIHDRILRPAPKKRSPLRYVFSGVGVVVAVVLCFLLVSGQFADPLGKPLDPSSTAPSEASYPLAMGEVIDVLGLAAPRDDLWRGPPTEQNASIFAAFPYDGNWSAAYDEEGNLSNVSYFGREPALVTIYYGEPLTHFLFQEEIPSDVHGVTVLAGVYTGTEPGRVGSISVDDSGSHPLNYLATFSLGDLAYFVKATTEQTLTEFVNALVRMGAPDLSSIAYVDPADRPVSPVIQGITLEEAYAYPTFSEYLPRSVPEGFAFSHAEQIGDPMDQLSVTWQIGDYQTRIYWNVIPITEGLLTLEDSTVFRADEITLDAIRAQAQEDPSGKNPGPHFLFYVLYDDMAVFLQTSQVSPEALYDMLREIQEGPPRETFPLTINEIESVMMADYAMLDAFYADLSEEQIAEVFPGMDGGAGIASYNGDGELLYVSYWNGTQAVEFSLVDMLPTRVEFVTKAPSRVHGSTVIAGRHEATASYYATFTLGDIDYVVTSDSEEDLTEIVNALCYAGRPDLSVFADPVIPEELRHDQLTYDQALADPDFGAYMPRSVPGGFRLESALRQVSQDVDLLLASWSNGGYDSIRWQITAMEDGWRDRLIDDPTAREWYDLSLYTIPWNDSAPEAYLTTVSDPIFRAEDLTPDILRARTYSIDDRGDTPGPRIRLGVLCGDILVDITVKGVTPEELFDMLSEIIDTTP